MNIQTIKVGSLQTNCYIVSDPVTKEAIVVDPGDEPEEILPEIGSLNIRYIVITHGHWDHIGAVSALKKATKAKVLMQAKATYSLKPDQEIKEGDEVVFGQTKLKVLATPGHSPGGICLYSDKHLFSGDTLFYGTYGRTDLLGSSQKDMEASLKRLATLPDDTIVYPGHGRSTTIKQEKEQGTLG